MASGFALEHSMYRHLALFHENNGRCCTLSVYTFCDPVSRLFPKYPFPLSRAESAFTPQTNTKM